LGGPRTDYFSDSGVGQTTQLGSDTAINDVNENSEIPETSGDHKPSAIEELEETKVLLKNKMATKIPGVESQRIKRILKIIEQYMNIVDIAIQHLPDITALVWAGVRLMIQV
jgi:midasin (ATPase involved in ribosome maturation)